MSDDRYARIRQLDTELHELPNCAVGGPLHIVTDDLNVRDSDLDFCEAELADHWSIQRSEPSDQERIRAVCRALIGELRKLTLRQRLKALR